MGQNEGGSGLKVKPLVQHSSRDVVTFHSLMVAHDASNTIYVQYLALYFWLQSFRYMPDTCGCMRVLTQVGALLSYRKKRLVDQSFVQFIKCSFIFIEENSQSGVSWPWIHHDLRGHLYGLLRWATNDWRRLIWPCLTSNPDGSLLSAQTKLTLVMLSVWASLCGGDWGYCCIALRARSADAGLCRHQAERSCALMASVYSCSGAQFV